MKYEIKKKYYSAKDGLFHIIKEKGSFLNYEQIDEKFTSFDAFYEATNRDLSNADLLYYNFETENLEKYNFSRAKISSQIMLKLGVYKKTVERIVKKDTDYLSALPMVSQDLVPCRNTELSLTNEEYDGTDILILYISDLHINHKLKKKFTSEVNEYELEKYLEEIVLKLSNTVPRLKHDQNKKILIVGDVSFDFYIFKKFFKIYKNYIRHQTFVVLGNHELWDKSLIEKCGSIEKMIEAYRTFLKTVDIKLLENQLYVPIANTHFDSRTFSEKEILDMSNEDLRKLFSHSGYAILGGIGFSGQNQNSNCDNGVYQIAPITREEEIVRSKRFEALHKKLALVIPDKKIFVVSHMPKTDWTTDDYVRGWTYISGHTHKNDYLENEDVSWYADNQVGYDNSSFGFKYLSTSAYCDIFADYPDGIHEISRADYYFFYRGLGENLNFNREYNSLFLVKRNNTFCFLMKGTNGNLYLLSGGQIKKTDHNLTYFYERLPNYTDSIKMFLQSYLNYQKDISDFVKKIGGDGHIHGCIVDIDFYNHLYVNPWDTTVTPYFAKSMVEKYVYGNLISLLKWERKDLYLAYKGALLLSCEDNDLPHALAFLKNDMDEIQETVYVEDTDMYKISRVIKELQYTTKHGVVRLWNDTIADKCSTENGKLIVKGIIYPKGIEKLPSPQLPVPKITNKKIKKPPLSEEDKQKAEWKKIMSRYFKKKKTLS